MSPMSPPLIAHFAEDDPPRRGLHHGFFPDASRPEHDSPLRGAGDNRGPSADTGGKIHSLATDF